MKRAVTVGKKELLSLGTRVGKFTKTRQFKIQITFLDYLAQYATVIRIIECLYCIGKLIFFVIII